MARTVRHLLTAGFLVVALSACGGDDEGDATAGGSTTEPTTEGTGADDGAPGEGGAEDDAPEEGAPGEVAIVDFTFAPEDITVAVGTTVTWANEDEATHSVADRELDFDSGNLAQGDTFEFTYDEAGEFPYVCGIHNYMKGTVTVE